MKSIRVFFLSENILFLEVNFSIYLNRHVFGTGNLQGMYRLISITKTCLYNVEPLKPQFHIVKLGFTGVYIIFLIFAQK